MPVNDRDCLPASGSNATVSALEFTGSYKGITGHDNVCRTLVREFYKRGLSINLHDLAEWSPAKLPSPKRDLWFDQLDTAVNAGHHLYLSMPHQVAEGPAKVKRINYTMFEADRIPASWVGHAKKHDLIIVPVNSCREAWIDSGVPDEKVKVCPLGVDAGKFSPAQKPLDLAFADGRKLSEFSFRFLNVADTIARKNYFSLLHAWISSTSADDDALLILKPGFYTAGSRACFFSSLRKLESDLGKSLKQAAPVFILDEVMDVDKMPRLYASATHYVSASRGEGFDLPMTEAGASGLQLIAPRHSSYLDYLNDNIAHFISAKRVKAVFPDDPARQVFFAGAHWWEPDRDELAAIFRSVIDGKAAQKPRAREVLSTLSWDKTAEGIIELISKLL